MRDKGFRPVSRTLRDGAAPHAFSLVTLCTGRHRIPHTTVILESYDVFWVVVILI